MSLYKRQKLTVITWVYWFLLIFIIAAWIWWFISLEKQNDLMYGYRMAELHHDASYDEKAAELRKMWKAKKGQYLSEGITFLLVTLLGAVFVYRATKKQILLSQQQRNFLMAVTHELKTPISITHLNLETLLQRKLDEQQQHKLMANALQEVDRLNILINNILTAAQLESGNYTLNKQQINFSELVSKSCKDFTARFPQRFITQDIGDHIFIEGEMMLLQLLVNNLLDNALKYSSAKDAVQVILKDLKGKLRLEVIDEGEGIEMSEKKKVFEKFYRAGNEATRTAKGTGLGLYLCKRIVHDHKGNITVKDNIPRGCVFTVTLNTI